MNTNVAKVINVIFFQTAGKWIGAGFIIIMLVSGYTASHPNYAKTIYTYDAVNCKVVDAKMQCTE